SRYRVVPEWLFRCAPRAYRLQSARGMSVMAPVNIAVATLHDDSAWDAFVRQAPGATFCHLAGWRHVLKEAMHHEPHYLAAVDSGGRIAGVLPLAQVRSRRFGVRYISLPCLDDGGPIGGDDAVAEVA